MVPTVRTIVATVIGVLATPVLLVPTPAMATEPARRDAEPEGPRRSRRDPAPPLGELSAQGTDNGALELGLGSTAVVVTAALIAHGVFQIFEGRRKAEVCKGFSTDPPECAFDGPNLRYAGAGLSFAFAIPVAVGAGLFLRKGVRIHRDFKAYRAREAAEAGVALDGVRVWGRPANAPSWVAGPTPPDASNTGAAWGVDVRLRF